MSLIYGVEDLRGSLGNSSHEMTAYSIREVGYLACFSLCLFWGLLYESNILNLGGFLGVFMM